MTIVDTLQAMLAEQKAANVSLKEINTTLAQILIELRPDPNKIVGIGAEVKTN